MTLTVDRIRRVAEKHGELQVPCSYANTKYTEGYGYTKEAVESYHNAHRKGNCPCAGTGWTPLDVRDWADALWKAGLTVHTHRDHFNYGDKITVAVFKDTSYYGAGSTEEEATLEAMEGYDAHYPVR